VAGARRRGPYPGAGGGSPADGLPREHSASSACAGPRGAFIVSPQNWHWTERGQGRRKNSGSPNGLTGWRPRVDLVVGGERGFRVGLARSLLGPSTRLAEGGRYQRFVYRYAEVPEL